MPFPLISPPHQSCPAGTAQVLHTPGSEHQFLWEPGDTQAAGSHSRLSVLQGLRCVCHLHQGASTAHHLQQSAWKDCPVVGVPLELQTEESERTKAWTVPSKGTVLPAGAGTQRTLASSKPMIRIVPGYQWNLKSLQCDRSNSQLRLRFLAAQGSSTHLTSSSARQPQQCKHYIIKATYLGLSLL